MLSDPNASGRGMDNVAGQQGSSDTAPTDDGIAQTNSESAPAVSAADVPNTENPWTRSQLWRSRQLWLVVVPAVLTCLAAVVQLVGFLLNL
jgi:hypothetical protein